MTCKAALPSNLYTKTMKQAQKEGCELAEPHLVPWMSFDLGKPEIRKFWIHASNFFSSWSTENLKEGNQDMVTL